MVGNAISKCSELRVGCCVQLFGQQHDIVAMNVGNANSKCSKLHFGRCAQLGCQKHCVVELDCWKCNSYVFTILFWMLRQVVALEARRGRLCAEEMQVLHVQN